MREGTPLKHLLLPLIAVLLLGCSPAANKRLPPPTPLQASPSKSLGEADSRPDLFSIQADSLTPAEIQRGLARLAEAPGTTVQAELQRLFAQPGRQLGTSVARPWIEADLDGDGATEYALALPALTQRAALFVIAQRDGRYQVDLDLLAGQSTELMGAYLHSAADLTGDGRPDLIWYRPELIATGPQPYAVFVTQWTPGQFTHLPGQMMISNMALTQSGSDLLLNGVSRAGRLLWLRTDTYRFIDGAFRLVDRRFEGERTSGYDRFWDGVVSEGLGHLKEAEAAYRAVLEEGRPAHPGSYPRYNSPPLEPAAAELDAFSEALRAFARFRLSGIQAQRPTLADSPYAGLLQAESCQAAAAWAEQNPDFLLALNGAITHTPWGPVDLCTHPAIDDLAE